MINDKTVSEHADEGAVALEDLDEPEPVKPPEPNFRIVDYLPEGITPAQNGIIPPAFLQKVYCGAQLCLDAARSWTAMVRAAALDGIFLNLNHPIHTYKNIVQQRRLFMERFEEVDPKNAKPDKILCLEFDNKLWQLISDKQFVERPGENSHGFGLAVFLANGHLPNVRAWLDANAADFGFVREYNFIAGKFIYIRGKQPVTDRVLEIESIPEPRYTADMVVKAVGGRWHKNPPPVDWSCNSVFKARPFRTGGLCIAEPKIGVDFNTIRLIFRQCAALVCTQPSEALIKLNRPILVVDDINFAIEKLDELFKAPPPIVETSPVDAEREKELSTELNFYRKANPETAIFQRKKALAQRLLDITLDDLKDAPKQSWYGEYLALLRIRIQDPALSNLQRQEINRLQKWYDEHSKLPERELAVAAMLQFVKPTELRMPFNQNSWHQTMIEDVMGAFLDYFTRVDYSDEDISTYYLAQQSKWRHGRRKMRVAFIFHSFTKGDKVLPVYEAMLGHDDIEPFIVLHPNNDYRHGNYYWQYFHDLYPDGEIYDSNGVMDLRQLAPDYVFLQSQYEGRREFPSIVIGDLIKYAKVCHIAYGSSLAHVFLDRMIDDYPKFNRCVRFLFCSSPTVKAKLIARYSENAELGYQHFEFLGYPVLDTPPLVDTTPHRAKRIIWTPRWSYDARLGGSHFLEYRDKFLELKARYGDKVELSMRPHMNLFRTLVDEKLMTQEEVNAYQKKRREHGIELYPTTLDLKENFKDKDILLTDYSTIMTVYFLTGRPIIYCDFPNAVFFDEYREMFDCMYIAHSWEDVERYLDDLIAGNDPLFERRQAAVKNMTALHAGAAERIVSRLIEDFKACEDA